MIVESFFIEAFDNLNEFTSQIESFVKSIPKSNTILIPTRESAEGVREIDIEDIHNPDIINVCAELSGFIALPEWEKDNVRDRIIRWAEESIVNTQTSIGDMNLKVRKVSVLHDNYICITLTH